MTAPADISVTVTVEPTSVIAALAHISFYIAPGRLSLYATPGPESFQIIFHRLYKLERQTN